MQTLLGQSGLHISVSQSPEGKKNSRKQIYVNISLGKRTFLTCVSACMYICVYYVFADAHRPEGGIMSSRTPITVMMYNVGL